MVELVFKALGDPVRRALLDRLFLRDGQTLAELCEGIAMTRFGVMKHLRVLEDAHLIVIRRSGREKFHYLNPVPIRLLHDRWISKYAQPWVSAMGDLKAALEGEPMNPQHVYEIYIRTTPEKLWQAITDGAITRQYYVGSTVESTWKKDAPVRYLGEGGVTLIEGSVLEAAPPRRLVHTFGARWSEGLDGDRASRVTWEIEPMGDACKLTLTHDDFDQDSKIYADVGSGWNRILSGLKTLLETGEPLALSA